MISLLDLLNYPVINSQIKFEDIKIGYRYSHNLLAESDIFEATLITGKYVMCRQVIDITGRDLYTYPGDNLYYRGHS